MIRRTTGERAAIGSMPFPVAYGQRLLAASGSLFVEHDIPRGAKVKLLCWRRALPHDSEFLSVELVPFDLSRR